MLETLALVVAPGIVAVILWSPILLVARLRRLFERLPPAKTTVGNYLPVAIGLSIPFVVGTGIVFVRTSIEGAALSNALLNPVLGLTIAYAVGLPPSPASDCRELVSTCLVEHKTASGYGR